MEVASVSEKGWLKDVLKDVRTEVASWPQWMQSADSGSNRGAARAESDQPEKSAPIHPAAAIREPPDESRS